jgi:2-succinyl-6-hydroxy-2,4-cyclohexadiene-1-carboxylate synthase
LETSLVFIHGFLGEPSDWKAAITKIKKRSSYFVDLNKDFKIGDLNFQAWPKAFKSWARRQKIETPIQVIGYSMGGRLALPLLDEGLINAALVLSSHLGIPDSAYKERSERKLSNQKWAEKFATESWDKVIKAWNSQEVFAGSTGEEPKRIEHHFDKFKLAAMLTGFSLSDQKDYSYLLKTEQLFYLAGENDQKYAELARKYQRDFPSAKIETVPQSGHRLLFDQPKVVADRIQEYLGELI